MTTLIRSRSLAVGMALTALVGTVLTACGSSSSNVVRTGGGGSSPAVSTPESSTPASSSSVASSTSSSAAAGKQTLTVTPHTNLRASQVVQVHGTGFTAGGALTLVECADKGTKTGPGDCNLTAMAGITADAKGEVSTKLTVVRGPFGSNKIVCSAQQKCLVSLTQASLSPTEEADAPISFRG